MSSRKRSDASDSVSTEHHRFYEESARGALRGILFEAFGICSREPERGFNAKFFSGDSSQNLLWKSEGLGALSTKSIELEIDFLGHTAPLSVLQAVNEHRVGGIPHVQVFKSVATQDGIAAAEAALSLGQRKILDSPEKEKAGDASGGDDNDESSTFQYVVAEITQGGLKTTKGKVRQLQRACVFLSSRASPTVSDVKDLDVLSSVALVVVVSPSVDPVDIFNYVNANKTDYYMVHTLMNAGRLVCIKHTLTLIAVVSDTQKDVAELRTELAELRVSVDNLTGMLQTVLKLLAPPAVPPPPPDKESQEH